MSGYNYNQFISDFTMRTIENQNKIDELREQDKKKGIEEKELDKKHHEVTQLINSLFGLLIVPYEKYKFEGDNSVSEKDMRRVANNEYNEIAKMIVELEQKGKLYNSYRDDFLVSSFIKHLRNSLAHSGDGGLQFMPIAQNKKISSILFHDEYNSKEFCTEITIGNIRKLTRLLNSMYKKLEHFKAEDDIHIYKEKYERYSELMKRNNGIKWAEQLYKWK